MERKLLSAAELDRVREELSSEWLVDPHELLRTVEFPAFLTAVRFIDELAPIAERLDHHPDLTLSWRTVTLRLATHSAGGVTEYDVALARELEPVIDRLS
ncbi:MAG TPA: 4a-hydroxytetrahydrobiopterin dehydratase [Jatrophihabitans sp.]|nr:4a-hydroxytetrahydrobiopterin dehydratase [Jatrophihabitans sp.]